MPTNRNRATKNSKMIAKAVQEAALRSVCEKLFTVEKSNGRLPYGLLKNLVQDAKSVCSNINRSKVKFAYAKFKKEPTHPDPLRPCKVGGHPPGTTDHHKRMNAQKVTNVLNDITTAFESAKQLSNNNGEKLRNGKLKEIITLKKHEHGLTSLDVPPETIRSRCKRHKPVIFQHGGGCYSPMLSLEPTLVTLIIQMSRIRQCLSPSDGLQLANSLVKPGSPVEDAIIEFKKRYGHPNTNDCRGGLLGPKYWQGFMKRNGHQLTSKRGQKYSMDRTQWTTYQNFHQMYCNVYDEMVTSGVAIKLDSPVWMDKDGKEVSKSEAIGFPCTHKITHPEMCVVADEVGSNTSQKGDGHVGGKKFLCEKGTIPYERCTRHVCHHHCWYYTKGRCGDRNQCVL